LEKKPLTGEKGTYASNRFSRAEGKLFFCNVAEFAVLPSGNKLFRA
jgi:hypothetical protein